MSDNLAIWNALGTTDPKHTKAFNRAGGFKGTALKPQWVLQRLTEQFGPCGAGWGVGEPTFNVVNAGAEVLVYCTVRCWHGSEERALYGVGGDKVSAKRGDGSFNDDEAFKKAFTDAVMNAFKFIGVGADIHLGLFDDSKYVEATKREFEAEAAGPLRSEAAVHMATETIKLCADDAACLEWARKNDANLKASLHPDDYDEIVRIWKAHRNTLKVMAETGAKPASALNGTAREEAHA